ncbi:MAG: hypothetical protein ABSH20_05555 [Tepidisphaeraceae bacterium]|jgi:hypothetical protein
MVRSLTKLLVLVLLVGGGAYGIYKYETRSATEARLAAENQRLQAENQHLQDFVARLTREIRRAEMVVTEQGYKNGNVTTTLLFSEIARDGTRLPPKFFVIEGNVVHIDSLVIKFELDFIKQNDPLRGHSIALFYRLYGDRQAPADGFPIDDPGQPPPIYRDNLPKSEDLRQFEADLWRNFWRLTDDAAYRKEMGVRLAQGESPWRFVYPDYVYTLSIEGGGGVNMASRPIDDLFRQYQEALKRQHATAAGSPK